METALHDFLTRKYRTEKVFFSAAWFINWTTTPLTNYYDQSITNDCLASEPLASSYITELAINAELWFRIYPKLKIIFDDSGIYRLTFKWVIFLFLLRIVGNILDLHFLLKFVLVHFSSFKVISYNNTLLLIHIFNNKTTLLEIF